jgi:hypothetical protein
VVNVQNDAAQPFDLLKVLLFVSPPPLLLRVVAQMNVLPPVVLQHALTV